MREELKALESEYTKEGRKLLNKDQFEVVKMVAEQIIEELEEIVKEEGLVDGG